MKMHFNVVLFMTNQFVLMSLIVVGLKYGYITLVSIAGKGLYLTLIALSASLIAILTGFFTGRYVFKMNWIILAGGICGSMTSTPGLGIAIDL